MMVTPLLSLYIHLTIEQLYIEHLLCARHIVEDTCFVFSWILQKSVLKEGHRVLYEIAKEPDLIRKLLPVKMRSEGR